MMSITEANSLYLGDEIFYLISFLITAALVWHFAWKPVTQMMKKRATKIADDIDNAKHLRIRANELAAKREDELKNSRQEAAKIIGDAKKSAEVQRIRIIESAHEDVRAMKNQAQKDAQKVRQDALHSAKDDVANLSVEIAAKLVRKRLDADDQRGLIDDYIKGLMKGD